MKSLKNLPTSLQFLGLLVVFFALCILVNPSESNYLWRLPPLLSAVPGIINNSAEFLMYEWLPIDVYDPAIEEYEQQPLFREITRGISGGVLFLITFIREILLGGVKTIVAFSSWNWVGENKWAKWPALPWTVIAFGATMLAYRLGGKGLALLTACATIYMSLFGQWEPTMQTLSFVLVAAPISVVLGLLLGIWAYKNSKVEMVLSPLLNVAQTMPHFSYLVPITAFFGVGNHAGAIATIIFATPPMVRLTILGLRNIPPEVIEAGRMSGCTEFQLMYKVLVPTARRDILIGVNQVIMQCLAMSVIASFIGATGLGYNLLIALNSLKVGKALEMGLCIVLLAVVLDKMSLAWANKQTDYFADLSFFDRNKFAIYLGIALVVGSIIAYIASFFFKEGFNYLYIVPTDKGFTTHEFWQAGVDWIWDAFFYPLKTFNEFLIVEILIPMKNAYLAMPVVATFVLIMGTGYIIGGVKSALIVGSLLLFIALSEYWDRALITAYMASFAVITATIIGVTAGTLCAQNSFASKSILLVCDFFQTFPSFIYLIPVIMLFGVTDTSVLIAAIVYAMIPATRYTVEGLRAVPTALQDAGSMSGVNRFQRWISIELPYAFPHMLLGINQTVVFSLFMVIIGAFIGTTDLGQLILKALSDKQGIGIGLTLGLCVAFIGLIADHLIRTWADKRKKALGLV
ncbi:MAG: glycine betaine/proline transport system permease protein [Saprospiraceae bacterium]|jgi:glycine betaine/proline transport system permease protein